jgi:AGCS family alanine or glycine:cation symporter
MTLEGGRKRVSDKSKLLNLQEIIMEMVKNIISSTAGFLWGFPLIILLVGTGLWLTLRLRGLQFTKLWHALYLALIKRKETGDEPGDITHFQALMTALSATVGTGNIAGVATAIAAGGPGALFWMWITGLVGMATKYAEAVLAVHYRETDEKGMMSGGPMYYISRGLKQKWLAVLFALFAAIAAFGIGNMVQSNSVAAALESSFDVPYWLTGIILTLSTAAVIIGGIKSIGRVTAVLVPLMIVFYVGAAIIILLLKISSIPQAINLILIHAFTPTAGIGGFLGSGVMLTIRMGVARGVFSNESGLGSSPIAAAAAKTKHPVSQALVSMTQTFIDTIVICSLTGLVLIVSGEWSNGKTGAELTTIAFSEGIGSQMGQYVVAIGLALFAYSTILGWSYYGEKSIEFLIGIKAIIPYRYVYTIFVLIGALAELDTVWAIADLFNALMAFPNLVALLALTPVVVRVTKDYFDKKNI